MTDVNAHVEDAITSNESAPIGEEGMEIRAQSGNNVGILRIFLIFSPHVFRKGVHNFFFVRGSDSDY